MTRHSYSIPFNNIKQLVLKLFFPKSNFECLLVLREFRLVLGPDAPLIDFREFLSFLQSGEPLVVPVAD